MALSDFFLQCCSDKYPYLFYRITLKVTCGIWISFSVKKIPINFELSTQTLTRTLQICRFFSPSFGGRMASAFSLVKSRSLYLVIGPMWQKFILLTIAHYSKIDWPIPLFGPRSSPFAISYDIFFKAKWSKIKERVEGWKSGKTLRLQCDFGKMWGTMCGSE